MLFWPVIGPVSARSSAAVGLAGALGVALLQCGDARDGEPTAQSQEGIVGGALVDGPGSPVVYVRSPQGGCTGILIAPTLVATARHCTAALTEGAFTCTSEGTLVATGSGAGEIGVDDSPGQLSFFSAVTTASGNLSAPDAVGVQILSTGSPNACVDDLAFVVMNQAIPGLVPAAIRLNPPTLNGENVSVWGYGLTETVASPIALRVFEDAQIVGVGAAMGTPNTQPAPVRSVRVGPGQVTCNGDSGGPILSDATGALIALVSLGTQSTNGGSCDNGPLANTTGPLLSYYPDLIASAFAAAGATPIIEGATDASADAGVEAPDTGPPPTEDATAPAQPDSGAPVPPPLTSSDDAACAFVVPRASGSNQSGSSPIGAIGGAIALALCAIARRRR